MGHTDTIRSVVWMFNGKIGNTNEMWQGSEKSMAAIQLLRRQVVKKPWSASGKLQRRLMSAGTKVSHLLKCWGQLIQSLRCHFFLQYFMSWTSGRGEQNKYSPRNMIIYALRRIFFQQWKLPSEWWGKNRLNQASWNSSRIYFIFHSKTKT